MKPALLLHRREFLKASTGVLTGIVAAGSPLALIAPSRAWAVDLDDAHAAPKAPR